LEQRLDRWVCAGRQFVDGVSGVRPGSRPGSRETGPRPAPPRFGRWVEERLDWLLDDGDVSAADVSKVVGADPAVATNVLRIVNSVYYGLQVRVSSVSLAISVMGFNMTKKVALKAAVFLSLLIMMKNRKPVARFSKRQNS
jgi:hypothetical protein